MAAEPPPPPLTQPLADYCALAPISLVSAAMGAAPSEILSQPLYALPAPVAATSPLYCEAAPVTLHLREHSWSLSGDDFTVREINSDAVVFRIDGAVFSISDRKTLLDFHNAPIAVMRNELLSFMKTFNIYASKDAPSALFRIKAKLSIWETVLDVHFRDVVSGASCRLGLTGDWRARAAVIWMDNGDGQRLPVARVYRPSRTTRSVVFGSHDYYLDIAPNVDMALMVLVCIALDETKKD